MTPQELINRSRELFDRYRQDSLNAAIEAHGSGNMDEAQRLADWAAYYRLRLVALDEARDEAAAVTSIAMTQEAIAEYNDRRREDARQQAEDVAGDLAYDAWREDQAFGGTRGRD